MALVLAYPFALTPAGYIAVVEDGSDDADAQAIAALVSTRLGERPLVPAFGVPDPVYGRLEAADVAAGLAQFGPPLTVVDVTTRPSSDTRQLVTVSYRDDAVVDPEDDALDELNLEEAVA